VPEPTLPAASSTPDASAEAVLRVDGLCKSFQRGPVLVDVSLDARAGRITGLFGPNGAGKSTLFRILMGLVAADRGEATLSGTDLLVLPVHRKVHAGLGYLPQDGRSFPDLSVRDNVLAVVEIATRERAARRARVEELLSQTGLEAVAERRYGRLSGGERRRVEIAKALAARPRILLLDEPFAGLDPHAVAALCELIRSTARDGVGILVTDHQVETALDLVEEGFVLVAGRVVCRGSPARIRQDDAVRRAYLAPAAGSPS